MRNLNVEIKLGFCGIILLSNKMTELQIKSSSRCFKFSSKDSDELTVTIPERVDPHYSMFTWPSAPVVAQYIWYNKYDFKNRNVVELGAGTALPGIVSALCGANVTLSDNFMVPESLENCKRSCEANNLNLNILGIRWGHFNEELLSLKNLNFIILSDCFYDPADFEDIIVTISFLLERNPTCKCIVGYQIRSSNWTIGDLLEKWHLTSTDVPLESFDGADSNLAGSNLPGRHSVQLLIIQSFDKQQ